MERGVVFFAELIPIQACLSQSYVSIAQGVGSSVIFSRFSRWSRCSVFHAESIWLHQFRPLLPSSVERHSPSGTRRTYAHTRTFFTFPTAQIDIFNGLPAPGRPALLLLKPEAPPEALEARIAVQVFECGSHDRAHRAVIDSLVEPGEGLVEVTESHVYHRNL